MIIPHGCTVAVADGAKFLLFRNDGDADLPNLVVEAHAEQPDRSTGEIGTDAPGSSPAGARAGPSTSAGVPSGRSSMEQPDYHQQAEDVFAADAVKLLNKLVLDHHIHQLIVVAPPKALGEMRKHFHKELTARLLGEISKEMTNRTADQIAKAIVDA